MKQNAYQMLTPFWKWFMHMGTLMTLTASVPAFAAPTEVFAAGSLRSVMQALAADYSKEAPFEPRFTFGPSGKLRERIEGGTTPALFASASPEHTAALVKSGKLRSQTLFARNSLCVAARPGLAITTETVVQRLLDPAISVGTSTPGADPSGDYTWEMFKKIDRLQRPGAFDTLDEKAKKLTGAEVNTRDTRPAYARILGDRQADVFVTYCTNAAEAAKEIPGITFARVPSEIDVASDYSIGIAPDAPEAARLFMRYVMGPKGQALLSTFGFGRVPQQCDDIPEIVRPAYLQWSAPATRLAMIGAARAAEPIAVGTRTNATLVPSAQIAFAVRDEGKRVGFGGSATFSVQAAGQYEVFSTQRGWIDIAVADSGELLASVRSDRWLGCAGVNKNLGFMLKPGVRYQLQLSEMVREDVGVLIAPVR